MGARREVWAICALLGDLEAGRGNRAGARALRARAATEVAFIADRAGGANMRAIFLSRPEVRSILDQ